MTIKVVPAFDAISENFARLPANRQACGYTTGSPNIKWTAKQWELRPHAVRICQDAGATDTTADILDVERGAATIGDCPPWATKARHSYADVARPGQREPGIYTSADNVTNVVNELKAAKITGIFLFIANWNLDDAEATAKVEAASGAYPVCGMQWKSGPYYDTDVFSATWLNTLSHVAPPKPVGPVRRTTNGSQNMNEIAAGYAETVPALIAYSSEHYMTADQAELFAAVLPAGIPFYTAK